ncbi:TIR domain-containing protein [Tahibacter sp.]|uniref:TIR domain-containing protein n=1 Tax=Tahibacter sp. TaxID=2056211 RepID=UPI0028C4F117|nr:TIR domain-containing protein [Tahibacter sp.]
MFSKSLEMLIGSCYREARESRHQAMGVEALLLALLKDHEVQVAIAGAGGDVRSLETELRENVSQQPRIPEGDERDTEAGMGFQRVLQRAVYHVQSSGRKEVKPINCLVACFGEKDSFAVQALTRHDIQRLDIVNYASHGIWRSPPLNSVDKIEQIRNGPIVAEARAEPAVSRMRVFISYSHSDQRCLDRLLVHLKPLEKKGWIDSWSDRRIRPGDKWKTEIASNMQTAAVAALLLSADFLASDFIVEQELPPLLINAEANGTRILPVILKPCGFSRDKILCSFQSINDPKLPLLGLGEIDQEHLYEAIAAEIHRELEVRRKS